jgi:ubiquinone/menaquinone biosynthesis C-methylase UbiE
MNTALAVMDRIPAAMARRTRLVYDALAGVYPVSSYLFHSRAHRTAIELSGLRDGMSVLEVATGSGELFQRLLAANPNGCTAGIDLSPRMAAHTKSKTLRTFPEARLVCSASDVCQLPFRDNSFDAVFCCFVFELIDDASVEDAVAELRRVVRPGGVVSMVIIPEDDESLFSRLYQFCGRLVPAFWGRRIEKELLEMFARHGFHVRNSRRVRQTGYLSRVVTVA